MNNFILIGHDRSGTSAISRTLSNHPSIELIFRPFNSGPIRRNMYKIFDDSIVTEEDILFFQNLQDEILYSSYFVSEWHKKFSTIQDEFLPEKLHVIISNINHFSVKWVSERFPKIEQWAIWRDPIQILNSCLQNNFYTEWYADSLEQVYSAVKNEQILNSIFGKYIDIIKKGSETSKTAFLIATRNYFLFKYINPDKIIDYDIFKIDPNRALKPVLDYFELSKDFNFNKFLNVDLNSIPSVDGYSRNKQINFVISEEEMGLVNQLFEPLYNVYKND